ncbi:SDR family oxidoreductase [soil metagenome]
MNFNETIFLTGFPGFIAAKLVGRLAKPDTRFLLLAEKSQIEKADELINEIAKNTKTSPDNFKTIEGDIRFEKLGMSDADYEEVVKNSTDVYHLAAIYDLGVKKEIAFQINVEGTRNVNKLVEILPNLRRYNYISTCYVAGKRTGDIFESELEHDAGFRNFYEETKYLAELEVEKLKKNFPVTIFRPSVVVGDSEAGETAKYDGIYSLINYLRMAPNVLRLVNVGNSAVKLNLVPVDFVVKSIAALATDENAVGKTIALADSNPLTTEQLFDEIAIALTNKKSVIKPPASWVETILMLPFSPVISGLPFPSVPYFFVPQTYDTKVADELLSAHNIKCPAFPSYVGNLLKFVEEHPKL